MILFPIVGRELRVAARRRFVYNLRTGVPAGILLLVGVMMLLSPGHMSVHELSQDLFILIGIPALAFCMLAGFFFTTDCLCGEKRDGTIGLLFLTDLKGHDIVFGKLSATSLHGIYTLLGIIPILAIPLLMGGVALGEFWRMVLVLLSTLFLSLAAGIFVSALSRDTRQAMLAMAALLVLFYGVGPLAWVLHVVVTNRDNYQGLMASCPVLTFVLSFDDNYRSVIEQRLFWWSLRTLHLLTLGLLAGACLVLPRIWQEKATGNASGGLRGWVRRWRFPRLASPRRRLLLLSNPFCWLLTRDRLAPALALLVAGLLVGLMAGLYITMLIYDRRPQREICLFLMFLSCALLHVVVKGLLAVEVSRRLSDDFQSGALELLAVTPLRHGALISGLRFALTRQVLGPAILAGLANLGLLTIMLFHEPLHLGRGDQAIFAWILLGGIGLLVTDLAALFWIGVWLALRGLRHHRVVLGSLCRVMLAPWCAIFVFFMFLAHGPNSEAGVKGMLLGGFVCSFGLDFALMAVARSRLEPGFRQLLANARFKA